MLQRLQTLFAIPKGHPQGGLVAVLALLFVICVSYGIYDNLLWLAFAPIGLLVLWVTLADFRRIYFLMMAGIATSTEIALPGGFGTDLPSEPLMWVLTAGAVVWFLQNWRSVDGRFFRHPVSMALHLHLAWMLLAAINSQDFVVSLKFILAKGWYVIVFYYLAGHIFQQLSDFKKLVWWFFVPLFFAVAIVVARHAAIGFSFEDVEYVMGPFFRNHVMYACSLAITIPFFWYATYWYRRGSLPWLFLAGGIGLFLVAINFAYTRAAYVALVAAIGIYWSVRLRFFKAALIAFALVLAGFIAFVRSSDNWLLFAPDYERTITHKRFENLLVATTRLEDISTMERVYRWVAASYMVRERPMIGHGPGTFYFYYKNYTVSSFKTYVSDNPERSGIHNYYLMTLVEQGFPGLIFFLIFLLTVLLRGARIWHQLTDKPQRRMHTAAFLCFALINLLMLMNDFVETDKIGSFFFISAAIIVNMDLMQWNNKRDSKSGSN